MRRHAGPYRTIAWFRFLDISQPCQRKQSARAGTPLGRETGELAWSLASLGTSPLTRVWRESLRQIDPKRAIPRAEHERTAKVFVGGLAPSVTSEGLKEFLSQFGQVMDATVMFDKETTRSKGFAFATFSDEDAVSRAMAASGIELQGKPVRRLEQAWGHGI